MAQHGPAWPSGYFQLAESPAVRRGGRTRMTIDRAIHLGPTYFVLTSESFKYAMTCYDMLTCAYGFFELPRFVDRFDHWVACT